jgi:hypothetical protein
LEKEKNMLFPYLKRKDEKEHKDSKIDRNDKDRSRSKEKKRDRSIDRKRDRSREGRRDRSRRSP